MQPDGKEYGYYVVRLIHDIILKYHDSKTLLEILKLIMHISNYIYYSNY
jgi:hypothetical protein